MTLQADVVPWQTQLCAMRLMAVAAGNTGREHFALLERSVVINLILHLPVGMIEPAPERCDDMGALLIFDEVQCGMGRTGAPFAANFYGVTPDMITAAKALGNGFPVSALLLSDRVAGKLKVDDMGTTFGGGPMACAVVEAVIDTIESESLLANVRQVSAYIRGSCVIGPVTGVQGAGFLLGLKTSRPAKEVQAALLAKNILTGTSADPNILRLLPAYILNEGHVDQLSDALSRISA